MKMKSVAVTMMSAIGLVTLGAGVASAQTPQDGEYIGTNGWGVPSFIWEGKTIHSNGTGVINRILGGIEAVPGDVYEGPSISNGANVVHIDYASKTPIVGALIHDEVTQDAHNPNQWNGVMYFTGTGQAIPLTTFTLVK